MFPIGSCVVYNEEGVCRVESIGRLNMSGIRQERQYYTLSPLSGDGKVYIPVDTPLPMRRAMTAAEATDLIRRMPQIETEVLKVNNKRMQEDHYREMMRPHTPEALVRTLKSIYAKRISGGEKVRALSSTDEHYRKRAEALLYQELGLALGIAPDVVENRIAELLGMEV